MVLAPFSIVFAPVSILFCSLQAGLCVHKGRGSEVLRHAPAGCGDAGLGAVLGLGQGPESRGQGGAGRRAGGLGGEYGAGDPMRPGVRDCAVAPIDRGPGHGACGEGVVEEEVWAVSGQGRGNRKRPSRQAGGAAGQPRRGYGRGLFARLRDRRY